MRRLPECDCRAQTEQSDIYFCRHPKVHSRGNLVDDAVCLICSSFATPCPNPIPIQSGRLIDTRQPPPLRIQAWNLAAALTAFVADGFRTVSKEAYEARLNICNRCDERRGTSCLQCGCRLAWKASGRAFKCPLDKWPELPTDDEQD
jgi:hypothetical protein